MIGCEHSILLAWGGDYHKVSVAQQLCRIQKKLGISEMKKCTVKYYCLHVCICIWNTCMHAYICIHIYIKEICEKQGIIQNWNQSLLRLRTAFHLDWLFLSCPVLLSPLKQPTLLVGRENLSCIPAPKGCQQKASSQTSIKNLPCYNLPALDVIRCEGKEFTDLQFMIIKTLETSGQIIERIIDG